MIKTVTVTNHLGESMVFDLRFPEKSGFLIYSIDGLGPGKASINITETLTKDGSIYNSAKANSRNIVLVLGFLPVPSIESVRQKSYKFFPIKKRIQLVIESDNRISTIYGYVESNEPNIWSKSESTTISILCPDPHFYSKDTKQTIFSGIIPAFEFPFTNNSLNESLIEFGTIQNKTNENVYYDGDSEIGIILYIHFLGLVEGIGIYNTLTRDQMLINTNILENILGSPIQSGDDMIISTLKGDKYIYFVREGEFINVLNCLDRDSNWFELVKGDNVFAYTADVGVNNMQFKIINQTVYEGV